MLEIGQHVGRLKLQFRAVSLSGRAVWDCRCKCGRECRVDEPLLLMVPPVESCALCLREQEERAKQEKRSKPGPKPSDDPTYTAGGTVKRLRITPPNKQANSAKFKPKRQRKLDTRERLSSRPLRIGDRVGKLLILGEDTGGYMPVRCDCGREFSIERRRLKLRWGYADRCPKCEEKKGEK